MFRRKIFSKDGEAGKEGKEDRRRSVFFIRVRGRLVLLVGSASVVKSFMVESTGGGLKVQRVRILCKRLENEGLRVIFDSSDALQRFLVDCHHLVPHLRNEEVPGRIR